MNRVKYYVHMPSQPTTEKSFWRESYTGTLYPQLTEDITVDVVIIGAGITGLTTAYLLKQAGRSVAVLEGDTVGGGTTGRTTGKVTSQHGLTYYELQKHLGTETARIYGEANQTAIGQVAAIIEAENIDCDWQRDDHYVYTTDPAQVEKFRQEAAAAAELGLPATFETTTPLPFAVTAAVKFTNQAKFNAQKYLLGLAKAVNGDGSYVFEHSTVTSIKDGKPARIRTKKASVTAKDIITATNVPTLPLAARGEYCILEYPTESFIVAGRPDKELRGMYISPDKHNYSILPIQVDGQNMILVGGEGGHLPGLRFSKKYKYTRLATYAEKHFGVSEITHEWSDRDYLAYDNIPLIGKLYPWSEHLYVGTAFRKWGLTNGTVAGMILRDLVIGTENPWAATFTPSRLKPVTSIPRAVVKYIKS
jgi:glycine/D-amino acid oxidase-like deaminating enzyme